MVTKSTNRSTNKRTYEFNLSLRVVSIILSAVGLLDSLYLSWVKLAGSEAYCAGIGDCDVVNSSSYSEIGGIPIALFGAGAYLSMILVLYMEKRGEFWRENGQLVVFGLSLTGVIYSAYLTYIELAILRAICPYCVVSALILFFIWGISIIRLKRELI
jgi:uncharacterized membrane protein